MDPQRERFVKLVALFFLVLCTLVYSQEIGSDGLEQKTEGDLNAMTSQTNKTRTTCNACEMEGCRRKCKETCRPCQYNFCHFDEVTEEYDCKCMRTPPTTSKNGSELPILVRVKRWSFPRRGKRIRNCKMH